MVGPQPRTVKTDPAEMPLTECHAASKVACAVEPLSALNGYKGECVVFVARGRLPPEAATFDSERGGLLAAAMEEADFKGDAGSVAYTSCWGEALVLLLGAASLLSPSFEQKPIGPFETTPEYHPPSLCMQPAECGTHFSVSYHSSVSILNESGRLSNAVLSLLAAARLCLSSCVWVRVGGEGPRHLCAVGVGEHKTFDAAAIGAAVASALRERSKVKSVALFVPDLCKDCPCPEAPKVFLRKLQAVLETLFVELNPDNRFKGAGSKNLKISKLERLTIFAADRDGTGKVLEAARRVASGVHLARELVNAPANVCTTVTLAKAAETIAAEGGLQCKILEQTEIETLGMGCYLSVAKGSMYPPQFIHLTYKPASGIPKKKLAFVGKGLCFDSGGYNIKRAETSIELMKFDMGGAAAVLGAAKAIAAAKPAAVEVHFISAAAENMVSSRSYRPGDIITASNGKTVEVGNTDAEGRLTLADALVYAEKLGVDAIVDVATLTGACIIALGESYAGLFSPDEHLAEKILDCAERTCEKMWRMPFVARYRDNLESKCADLNNTATKGKGGGAITAAVFLKEFVEKTITNGLSTSEDHLKAIEWFKEESMNGRGAIPRRGEWKSNFLLNGRRAVCAPEALPVTASRYNFVVHAQLSTCQGQKSLFSVFNEISSKLNTTSHEETPPKIHVAAFRDGPSAAAVPLMVGLLGGLPGAPPGAPSVPPLSGTGSTPLGRLAAAPPPVNRTLGRLGAGSWMRLAMERTSALLATEQAARSSRQQEKQQRQKAARDNDSAEAAQEEPASLAGKAGGPLTPPEAPGELSFEPQAKNKTKRKKGASTQADDSSEDRQADRAPPGKTSEGFGFKGPVEGLPQGSASEASASDKAAVSKRPRKKDGMKNSALEGVPEAAAASTAAAATAANPILAHTTTGTFEQQEVGADAVASRERSSGVSGLSSGANTHKVGLQEGAEGAPRSRPRRPKKAAPQGACATDEDVGLPVSSHSKRHAASSAAALACRGCPSQGPQGEPQKEARSLGAHTGGPSPGGPPPGDFSFVVGLIGGLAVPASATPGAPGVSEGQRQQEEAEIKRKSAKVHGRKRDEQEGVAFPSVRESPSKAHAASSRGPHDLSEHGLQQRRRKHAQQQQQQQHEQQEQTDEEQQRRSRRKRRRRRRHRDSEPFPHSCPEGLGDEGSAKAAAAREDDEGAPACGAASRTIGGPSSSGAPGTSVGVQAEIDPCHCFPSVWAADAAAAKGKAIIAEKRRLLRLLGAPEAGPIEGPPCAAPTAADPSASERERALLKRLWLPAALAAWEGGGQRRAQGGQQGGGLFWEEGPLSSSSESAAASPLRGPPETSASGPVLHPRYVSFGGDTTGSLFTAARDAHPFCGTAAAAAATAVATAAATGDLLSGEAARLLRALRRTHRRLVLGGQSAVLRSDSSSEEEVSSREPSPAAASHDEATVSTAAAPAAAAAAAAAASRAVALPASPGVTSTEGFNARERLLQKHKTCAATTSFQRARARRPRQSAPAAVGWPEDHLWSSSSVGSRSSDGKEEEGWAPASSTSNSSSRMLLSADCVAGPICVGEGDCQGQSRRRPPKPQRGGTLQAAVTPAGVRASRAGGESALSRSADALTPLLMEAPTITSPWELSETLSTHPQQQQEHQHQQMMQHQHQQEQHGQQEIKHRQAQLRHQQEPERQQQEHHQEEQQHHTEHQQQQQQERQAHVEVGLHEVTSATMRAAIGKGLSDSAGGPEPLPKPGGPRRLEPAPNAPPSLSANLLSSPAKKERPSSFDVRPLDEVMSQEESLAGRASPFREAAEPAEDPHDFSVDEEKGGPAEAEGPQLQPGEGGLYARQAASSSHSQIAEGGGGASAATEHSSGWWEELLAAAAEVALSDVESPELRALVNDSKSPHSPRLSPFVTSVPESDADSLPPQTSSPMLLHHDLECELQQEEERVGEVNENLSMQQQPQQQQHDLDRGFKRGEKKAHTTCSVWSCENTVSSEAPQEASITSRALWFRSLGERRLEEHKVAGVPRASRCGFLSAGSAILLVMLRCLLAARTVLLHRAPVLVGCVAAEEVELARRLIKGPLEGPSKVRYGIPLSWRTLAAVGSGGLLDDDAVNLYFALLQERNNRALVCGEMVPRCLLLPSHFHSFLAARGFAAIRRWTLRGNVDLFSYDLLLLPVYVAARAHWALGCVLVRHKVILYLDSLRQDDDAIRV
ncbi:hypothetical protein ACSSS7_005832 [Eimeria intestinalis]